MGERPILTTRRMILVLIVLFIPAAYLANRWSAQAARDRDEARVLRRLESNMVAELEEAAARPWMQPLADP